MVTCALARLLSLFSLHSEAVEVINLHVFFYISAELYITKISDGKALNRSTPWRDGNLHSYMNA